MYNKDTRKFWYKAIATQTIHKHLDAVARLGTRMKLASISRTKYVIKAEYQVRISTPYRNVGAKTQHGEKIQLHSSIFRW